MTSTRTAKITLPADDQILIVREIDARRELVWSAFTTPELVRRWWHAGRGEMAVVEIDLRVGGRWRYVMSASEGGVDLAFHGEYREIVPCERIVLTEAYEGAPDAAPAISTTTFEERDGRTTLTILVQHASRADRDALIDAGIEDGVPDGLDLLEQTAAALR